MNGRLAIDNGDWAQPLFKRTGETWQLHKVEVLYRLSDPQKVPFPAFVNFVKAASDQSPDPDPDLRVAFLSHAVSSLQRMDTFLSCLQASHRAAMEKAGFLTSLNFTAKQLEAVLSVPLQNGKLLAVEETEYDEAPECISSIRK